MDHPPSPLAVGPKGAPKGSPFGGPFGAPFAKKWARFGTILEPFLAPLRAPPFEQKHKGNKGFGSFSGPRFGSFLWSSFGALSEAFFGGPFGPFWGPLLVTLLGHPNSLSGGWSIDMVAACRSLLEQ